MTVRTLPAAAYHDPDIYRAERDRILAREWLLVAHVDQLAAPGDYFCLDLIGEPIIVIRHADGSIRALSAVCRHRYMSLADPGRGHAACLTCPYHSWSYALDGRLVESPHMADVAGFDRAAHRLPSLPVEVWQGLVFVSLNPHPMPLGPRLAPVSHALARYRLDTARQVGFDDRMWACNWKVAVENASECYHHGGTHRDSFDATYPARTTHGAPGGPGYAVHFTPAVGPGMDWGVPAEATAAAGLTRDDLGALGVYTLFPNALVINAGPLVVWFGFLPAGPHRTRFLNGVVAPAGLAPLVDPEGAARTLREINDEDEPIVEGVQRGVGSALATPGVLSHRESSLPDFYAYLHRMLAGDELRRPGRPTERAVR